MIEIKERKNMRYDKLGNALLHKLGRNASFAEVYLTAVELGLSIRSRGAAKLVLTEKTGEDRYGNDMTQDHWVEPERMAEFLNQRMVDEGIIKEEIPE